MKKIILLSIIILICIIGLIGCQTFNSTNKIVNPNINDDEPSEKKALETIKQMVDEPVSDTFDLYFVTSGIDNFDDFEKNVENLENFEKNKREINKVIAKLNDKNGEHVFSEEAQYLIDEMTYSAEQVIHYKGLEIENRFSDNEEKQDEMEDAYLKEITNIAELMVRYEKLYVEFKNYK